jgi:hypothetical protein
VLTVEGDDEGVIDDADGSAGFVGIVAVSTSIWRSPSERGRPRRWSFRAVPPCRRAASAPRRCAPPVRLGLPPIARGTSRAAPRLAVVRVAAPITEFEVGSYPQFVVIATVAPSSLGLAVNTRVSRATRELDRLLDPEGRDRTGVDRCRQVTRAPA